jgi:RND family efflux transporter MFP subunit
MKNLIVLIIYVSTIALIFSCHKHTEGDGHDHGDASSQEHGEGEEGHDEHEESSTVSLTAEQMKSIDLQLGTIVQKNLTTSAKANGFLKVPNQNKATITSLYAGTIKSINIMPGSTVSRGQTIATIVNAQFIPMQEEYLSLAPKIVLAEETLKRQEELTSGNAGALKNLQAAEAELKSLQIRHASITQQLKLMGINASTLSNGNLISQLAVRSPIGGSIGSVMVNIGATVDSSTPIAEVVDNSQLHLDLFVYEKDLLKIHKGQSIEFVLTNQPGKSYTAEVFSIGTTFESETKSIAVHCVVNGDKRGLIEGMSVTAKMNLSNAEVAALPSDAFVNEDGVDYVFIESENNEEEAHQHKEGETEHEEEMAFERIPVKKGVSEFGYTSVTLLADVPKETKFVTKGAFFLLAKMTNAGEAHAH